MNFGEALEAAKAGKRISRAGWNGRTKAFVPTGDLKVGGYFVMWTADGTWQPGWLASQADMLASDWDVVGDVPA